MKLGVFSVLFAQLSFDDTLKKVKAAGLDAIEIGTGAYPGDSHCDVDALLADPAKAKDYRKQVDDSGLTISALSCHGNPLHPKDSIATEHDEIFRKTVRLAEQLEVLAGLVDAGTIRTVLDRRWPLDQMAEAHRYVDLGEKTGGVVIDVVRQAA